MGRMGGRRHLKRAASPAFWPIHRKEKVWIIKPSPGPHPKDRCIPLMVILRNLLGVAKNRREADKILAEGKVKVDGRVRRDGKFPAGLMDVVEVEGLDKAYRVVPHPKEYLTLIEVNGEESSFKLCRIENKTTVKGGHIQLNLHDGRNLLIRVSDPTNPEEDRYETKDTIKLDLRENKILGHYRFKEGAYAVITGGKNVGIHGVITAIERPNPLAQTMVRIRAPDGIEYGTVDKYVLVVGEGKPEIRLPEVLRSHGTGEL